MIICRQKVTVTDDTARCRRP